MALSPVDEKEIKETILAFKNKKSQGYDGF